MSLSRYVVIFILDDVALDVKKKMFSILNFDFHIIGLPARKCFIKSYIFSLFLWTADNGYI